MYQIKIYPAPMIYKDPRSVIWTETSYHPWIFQQPVQNTDVTSFSTTNDWLELNTLPVMNLKMLLLSFVKWLYLVMLHYITVSNGGTKQISWNIPIVQLFSEIVHYVIWNKIYWYLNIEKKIRPNNYCPHRLNLPFESPFSGVKLKQSYLKVKIIYKKKLSFKDIENVCTAIYTGYLFITITHWNKILTGNLR